MQLCEPPPAPSSSGTSIPLVNGGRSAKPLLWRLAEFVKLSHTLFALPFALISMLAAGGGRVHWPVFGWILVCMAAARTAAMSFNRLADWEID